MTDLATLARDRLIPKRPNDPPRPFVVGSPGATRLDLTTHGISIL